MFSYSSHSPCEIQGTIWVNDPVYYLGPLTDVDGKKWDVHGIIGNYVQAVPMNELHSYFTDTSGFNSYGLVQQTWKPYLIKVKGVDDQEETTEENTANEKIHEQG